MCSMSLTVALSERIRVGQKTLAAWKRGRAPSEAAYAKLEKFVRSIAAPKEEQ